jgi:Concanavalin A-like lectin/glucanases superfamily
MTAQTRFSGRVPGYSVRDWLALTRLMVSSLLLIAILLWSGTTVTLNASGGSGNTLQFDGTDDYVEIPNSTTLNPAAVTVEAWVKVNAFTSTKWGGNTGVQYIVFKQNTRVHQFEGYSVQLADNVRQFACIVSSATGTQGAVPGLGTVNLGEWYHLALVADNVQVSFYVNGELQGTDTTGYSLDYAALPLYFGRTNASGGGWEGFFNGQIDEVRIWNTTLTQTTIRQWMHREVSDSHPNYGNLVGYWKLNEGSGQTVYDATANDNDGTLGSSSGSGSDDPTWVTSTAPINNLTTHQNDITAMWAGRTSTAADGFATGLEIADVSFLNATGDDIVFGHNNAAFANVTTSLPTGVGLRWARVWELAATDLIPAGGIVDLTFDISDAGGQGNFTSGTYFLLKRDAGSSADFTTVPVSTTVVSGDQLTFRVDVNNLASEFTLGATYKVYLPLVLRGVG